MLLTQNLFLSIFGLTISNAALPHSHHLRDESEYVTLVDNCKDLADGSYYMKLLDDSDEDFSYPIVKVKCQSGFLIIDVNYDNALEEYFTSWAMWHSSIAGPTNADIVDWENWFMKSRQDTINNKFLLSPDCNLCEEEHARQHFEHKSTYWMSGNLFGCFWMFLGKHNCDLDKDTYTCYSCSASVSPESNGDATEILEEDDPSAYYYTGQCATAVRSSDSEVTASHDTCQLGLNWEFANSIFGNDYESDYPTNKGVRRLLDNDNDDNEDETGAAFTNEMFENEIFKPSLGTDGRFCVCQQSLQTNYLNVKIGELTTVMEKFGDDYSTFHQFSTGTNGIEGNIETNLIAQKVEEEKIIKTSENNIVHLKQSDFVSGTFRIKEAGTYVVSEDITFDFNAGSFEDPQAAGAWKPWASQVEEYPGAETGRDEYFLGFFAGITIECDDVVLDLNGHTIGMSEAFYHQQRWFTTISLTSQFFLPGNGPGFFGYDPKSASNVIIKNGIIGLSSHFGIHGNYNSDVLIQDVQVRDFEVHGIQFNGFERLTMKNVEVGPSSKIAYMTGEYGHMRYVLDRLNHMIDDLEESGDVDDAFMNYYGRNPMHIKQLAAKTERMMNYAFDYVVQGTRLTEDDFKMKQKYQEYLDAIDIFVNPSGIPYASVLHGIFLNTKEASVMTYNLLTTTYSEGAILENIKIHDLEHSMDERVRMYNDIYMFFGPFLNCLNARQLLGDDVIDDASYFGSEEELPYTYAGSIVTDVYLALTKYSNNWDYLEKMLTGAHILVPWAEGEMNLPAGTNIACNMDVMIHSGKGTTGLRLDGVKDISVKGLEVYNLHDSTPSGETVCGEYSGFNTIEGGGHLAQQAPMQLGFSGNKVQGVTFNSAVNAMVENVKMYNFETDTGPIMGLAVWPANDLTISGEIIFEDFNPSTQIDFINDDNSIKQNYPNQDHFACGLYLYEKYKVDVLGATSYSTDIIFDENIKVSACGINNNENGVNPVFTCYINDEMYGPDHNIENQFVIGPINTKSQSCNDETLDKSVALGSSSLFQQEQQQSQQEQQKESQQIKQQVNDVNQQQEEDEPEVKQVKPLEHAIEVREAREAVINHMKHSGKHSLLTDTSTIKLFGIGFAILVLFAFVFNMVRRAKADEPKYVKIDNIRDYGTLSA